MGYKACYIGETKHHLNARTEEHLGKDKKSHIYIHTSKKIHNAKKKLILIVLKLYIVLLLILGYKLRKQCILLEKKIQTQQTSETRRYYYLYIGLLFILLSLSFHFLFIFFFCIPLLIKFYILIIYLLILTCF